MTPSGAYRHAHVAQGPFFHPKDAMRYNRDISGGWTNQRASRWRVLMTRSAHMFGLSWERKPRRGRIFSRPGRDLTPRNNFWQISKTRLPRPLTSPVVFLAIRKHCIHTPGLRVWDWALSVAERHGTPSGQYPGVQQRDPDGRIGRGYRIQPWDKRGRADRL